MSISAFRETLSEALTVGIKTHNPSKGRKKVTMERLVLTGTSVLPTFSKSKKYCSREGRVILRAII